jgi:hypothetical protein
MAEIVKKRTMLNPGRRRRRRLTPLQKLYFGTKRQRAAVAGRRKRRRVGRRRNAGGLTRFLRRYQRTPKRKRSTARMRSMYARHQARVSPGGILRNTTGRRKLFRRKLARGKAYYGQRYGKYAAESPQERYKRLGSARRSGNPRRRRRNISSIVTVYPFRNPARRRRRGGYTVARRRRRRVRRLSLAPIRRRRRSHRRRRHNPAVSYRRRRYYPRRRRRLGRRVHHRRHYRRNPGMLGSTAQSILGVMGGVALTKTLCTFVPAQFATGIIGYVSTGIIAVGQGKLIAKLFRSPVLGHNFMVGGLAYLVSKMLNDFLPALGGYGGIGLIGGSSFYNPQVNLNGSMGSFVVPGAVMGAIGAMTPATTTTGVRGLRRTGRLM